MYFSVTIPVITDHVASIIDANSLGALIGAGACVRVIEGRVGIGVTGEGSQKAMEVAAGILVGSGYLTAVIDTIGGGVIGRIRVFQNGIGVVTEIINEALIATPSVAPSGNLALVVDVRNFGIANPWTRIGNGGEGATAINEAAIGTTNKIGSDDVTAVVNALSNGTQRTGAVWVINSAKGAIAVEEATIRMVGITVESGDLAFFVEVIRLCALIGNRVRTLIRVINSSKGAIAVEEAMIVLAGVQVGSGDLTAVVNAHGFGVSNTRVSVIECRELIFLGVCDRGREQAEAKRRGKTKPFNVM